jgi:hypothetical protein
MKLDQDLNARLYTTSVSRNKDNKLNRALSKSLKKAKTQDVRTKPDQYGTQTTRRKQGSTNHNKDEGRIPKEQNEMKERHNLIKKKKK